MLTKKYIINSVIFLIDYLYFDFFKRARFLFVESFLNGANVNMSKCKCGMSHDQSQKFDVISMLIQVTMLYMSIIIWPHVSTLYM